MTTPPQPPMRSLQRVSDILECLVRHDGETSLPDLLAELGLSRASARRTLGLLQRQGLVLMGKERVSLGPRAIHLGYTASLQLGRWARPVLVELAAQLKETTALSVLHSDRVVVQEQALGPYQLGVVLDEGARELPHSSAAGKVLLAELPPPQLTEVLERITLERVAANTITSRDALVRQLELVRSQGYAVDDSERIDGVRSVAVPVPDSPRSLAISVSAPEGRLSLVAVGDAVLRMQESADRISRWLQDSTAAPLTHDGDEPR